MNFRLEDGNIKSDINESLVVKDLIEKMDGVDIGEVNKILERIVKNQPFIMYMLINW
ncbi:MAG: hypothetical protein ACI9P5_004008 [Saprospiraceae bacterium]|jgi:hypothetical protein|tara:strand:- start:233 stop:403 length:171 start_codon:yes stop_codon:yes gene_type:complete